MSIWKTIVGQVGGSSSSQKGSTSREQKGGGRKMSSELARAAINREVRGLCASGRFKIGNSDRDRMISEIGRLIENGELKYRDPRNAAQAVQSIAAKYCDSERSAQLVRDRVLQIFS